MVDRSEGAPCQRLCEAALAVCQGIWSMPAYIWDGIESWGVSCSSRCSRTTLGRLSAFHNVSDGVYMVASVEKNTEEDFADATLLFQSPGWRHIGMPISGVSFGLWGLLAHIYRRTQPGMPMRAETESTSDLPADTNQPFSCMNGFYVSWIAFRQIFSGIKNGGNALQNGMRLFNPDGQKAWFLTQERCQFARPENCQLTYAGLGLGGVYALLLLFLAVTNSRDREEPDATVRNLRYIAAAIDGLLDGLYIPGNLEVFLNIFLGSIYAAPMWQRLMWFLPLAAMSVAAKVSEIAYGGRETRSARFWHVFRAILNGAKNEMQIFVVIAAAISGLSLDDVVTGATLAGGPTMPVVIVLAVGLLVSLLRAVTSVVTSFNSLKRQPSFNSLEDKASSGSSKPQPSLGGKGAFPSYGTGEPHEGGGEGLSAQP